MSLVDWKLIEEFQNNSQTSVSHAARNLLSTVGIAISVQGSIPNKNPTLFIANHDGGMDSIKLLSVILRDDLYMVALASYQVFGSEMTKRVLPMYRARTLHDYVLDFVAGGFDAHILKDRDMVRQKNRQSITHAAKLISNGHAVLIFPTGTAGQKPSMGTWKAGVGFLVKQITNSQTQIVFVHIMYGSPTDVLRYIVPSLRTLFFKPKTVQVIFSKPLLLSKLIDWQKSGKHIAEELERHYHKLFHF